MSAIHSDAANETYDTGAALSDDDAEAAFLTSFKVEPDAEDEDAPRKKKPSEEVETTTTEDDAANTETEGDEGSEETPETEGDEGEEEAPEEKPADKKYVDSDDIFVKVKDGDTVHDVPVKDLKRLFGQEASLTRKSQEVAEQRRVADEGIAKNVAALNVMLEKAKAKADPYTKIDWLAVSKNPNISAEEASALRDEAQKAIADVTFFEKDLGNLMTAISDKQKADTAAQAKVCVTTLSTPGTEDKPNLLHIEGWNDKVYADIRSFARELGADANAINSMVDPVAIKVLHMAMQFKRGSSKVLTVKTNKSPKKIVKTSSSAPAAKNNAAPSRAKALTALQKTGSDDDAMNAFLAGMVVRD